MLRGQAWGSGGGCVNGRTVNKSRNCSQAVRAGSLTHIAAGRGPGVDRHDDPVPELEGQRGGAVLQVDAHPAVTAARADELGGL